MIAPENLAQEIADHVGCRGIAGWLAELADTLGIKATELMPVPIQEELKLDFPARGLRLVMSHPHAGDVAEGDLERWVLTQADFTSPWTGRWPFGLDAATATPEQTEALLGSDMSGLKPRDIEQGDLRQTYFLKDARAIGISWKAGLVGFDGVQVTRLGVPEAFKDTRNETTSTDA